MSARPLLEARGLTKSFFGVTVLHGLDLAVAPGRALGLVGENGSGKSTAMNVLGGVHRPDGGTMEVAGAPYAPARPQDAAAAGIAFIHQELNLFPYLSIEENLAIGGFPRIGRLPLVDRRRMRRRAAELMAEIELDRAPGTPVLKLSQGERQLVEIAKALSHDARVIIFDEPTTSLTRPEVERLFALIDRLKARGIGVIYISHALDDVLAVCDEITVLRDGHAVGSMLAEDARIATLIAMMVGRSIDAVFPERAAAPRDRVALSVRSLTQPGVARDVSFDLRAGEVLGLCGLMGSGRSEIARMIFGLDPFASGAIAVEGTPLRDPTPQRAMAAGMAFLTEDRRGEGLLMPQSVSRNVTLASLRALSGRMGLVDGARARETARRMAQAVRLSTDAVEDTQVRHLSGGNQQKVVLAKWLAREPRVFILDEPTRGIDVGAKQEVYRIVAGLVERGGAVLLISSEIEELIGLSDRILTISRGAVTGAFDRAEFDAGAIMTAAAGLGGRARA